MRYALPLFLLAVLVAVPAAAREPSISLDTSGLQSSVAAELEYHFGKCWELEDVGHCRKAVALLEEQCEGEAVALCGVAARMYTDAVGVGPDEQRAKKLARRACGRGIAPMCEFTAVAATTCTIGRLCGGACIAKDDHCAADAPVVVVEAKPEPTGPKILGETALDDLAYHRRHCLEEHDEASCRKLASLLAGYCADGFEDQCPEAKEFEGYRPPAEALEKRNEARRAARKKDEAAAKKKTRRRGGGKRCKTGKPCGNTCIASWKKCHK